jgi:hypothetical protein
MSTPVRAQGPLPAEQLMQLVMGHMVTAAVYSVTKLGIPDLLGHGARPVAELAKASGTKEDALYRVMRALASVGLFTETTPRTFELTPVGEYLRKDSDGSFRDMALWMGDKLHFQVFPELQHSLRTGETLSEKVFGVPCFEYFEKDKEVSEVFNAAMTTFSKMAAPTVLEAYDFSWLDGKTLVDLGGGHGHLLTGILKEYPKLRGIIFDLEHVLKGTKERIREVGMTDRCQTEAGDFFTNVPAGDAYIMKHIIHDWSDEKVVTILKNCHRAGRGETRVILVESVLTAGNEPHMAKWLDLEMMMLPGGRERTREEFAELFAQAGFRLERIVPTKSPTCVIEAVRA